MHKYGLIIVGGGAAGLVCAITAARRGKSVLVLEKNPALGKKIYATGNGRCNITNKKCENAASVQAFFHSIGLEIMYDDDGWAYPMSRQAADVVYLLEKQIRHLGVEVLCSRPVDWIEKTGSGYKVSCSQETYESDKILISCGGKAAPKFGTTGDGFALAQTMGHSIKRPIPVLTGIECSDDVKKLKGVRAMADCTLYCKGEMVFSERGEVQFTDYGLSGICIFNMSRFLLLGDNISFSDYEIHLDFSMGNDIKTILEEKKNVPGLTAYDALRGILPEELGKYIVSRAGESTCESIEEIARCYCGLTFSVKGARGWQMAQCTKGGVSLDEINMDTMESKLTPGLFFAGEVIDYDGPCGGYNLQNAWESGIKAGMNV